MNTQGKFSQTFIDILDVTARELADTSKMSNGQARCHVRSRTQFSVMSEALGFKLERIKMQHLFFHELYVVYLI